MALLISRFAGKEKRLALGNYPIITLKEARERRDDARKLLANDVAPGQVRKATKLSLTQGGLDSFEVVAREWIEKFSVNWVDSHGGRILRRLERDIFPWLGAKSVSQINAPELLQVIRRIEKRGTLETAHRVLQNCGQVFRYAVATGRAEKDITPLPARCRAPTQGQTHGHHHRS